VEVDIVVRGRGTAVEDQEMAKGGGTRDKDWAGVEEWDGTVEMGCFPLYKVAADMGSGFRDSGSSPGRDWVHGSGVRGKSAREVDSVVDSRSSETCCSSSVVKSTGRWFKYSQWF
jgi:hypothetical protein